MIVAIHCENRACPHRCEMHTMWIEEVRQVLTNQGWLITTQGQWCPRCRPTQGQKGTP